jgi:hypothetical protein
LLIFKNLEAMKKYLLTLILFASAGLMAKLEAQCTVSNVSVKINSTTPSGSNCVINMDLSYDLESNVGNKYDWIHLWLTSSYPNLSYGRPPTSAELVLSAVNIGINDNTGGAPIFQTTYPPSTGVTVQVPGSLTKTPNGLTDRFTITGILLTFPGACSSVIAVKGDVWSSNAASQQAVHCVDKGITFVANDPIVSGLLLCQEPRKYAVTISTLSSSVSGTYNVYRDDDGNGIISGGDVIVASNVVWSATSGSPYQSGLQSYAGNNTTGLADKSLLVEVTTTGLFNKTTALIPNSCIPLPVGFAYFNAKRSSSSNVSLTWQTSFELNNTGFAVERNSNGSWKQVAFVASQASGGNSNSPLSYQYNDLNSAKGISQYRVKQIDFNGIINFSEVRAVRGLDQPIKTIVYPNPSFDGKVNVVFEDALGIRDISLTDMSGRVVKNWNGVSNNNLQIDNLTPGFYSLRVVVRETGAQSVEKIVVNKR